MHIFDAARLVQEHGEIGYHEAITIATAYIRKAEARYARAMRIRDNIAQAEAEQMYARPLGRGQSAPDWDRCYVRGERKANKDVLIEEQVSASKTEYAISQAYSSLAVALAAGRDWEYKSTLAN